MTDEVSTSFHIASIMACTASIIAVVAGLLIVGIKFVNEYNDKYVTTIDEVSEGGIYSLTTAKKFSLPVIYSSLNTNIDKVNTIIMCTYNESTGVMSGSTLVYKLNDPSHQDYSKLLSEYRLKEAHVEVTKSSSNSLLDVKVGVIP